MHGYIPQTDEVKATFLFNFAKFVEWPADLSPQEATPFMFGVLGDSFVENTLNNLVRRESNAGRKWNVKSVTVNDDLTGFQVLFISASDKSRVADILQRLDGTSVLTISELDRFCQMGGVIQFAMEDQRIRFDVNLDSARRARLTLSSKLLRLAKTVHSTTGPGGH